MTNTDRQFERAEKLRRRMISIASNLYYAMKDKDWAAVERIKQEADHTLKEDY